VGVVVLIEIVCQRSKWKGEIPESREQDKTQSQGSDTNSGATALLHRYRAHMFDVSNDRLPHNISRDR
jgi:hypothetical protein